MTDNAKELPKEQIDPLPPGIDRPRPQYTPKWRRKSSDNHSYKGGVLSSVNEKHKQLKHPSDPNARFNRFKKDAIVVATITITIFLFGLIIGLVLSNYINLDLFSIETSTASLSP